MKFRLALALGTTSLILLTVAGCGSDDPAVEPADDRSGEISQLQRQKQRLEKQIRAQEKIDAAAAEKKTVEVGGDTEVNSIIARLPGQAGLVAGPPGSGGPDFGGGSLKTGVAWSTIKVPIAERVLEDAGGPNRITPAQADEITRAITLSDNDAAASLFAGLEAEHGGLQGATGAVNEMLLHAGDRETSVSAIGRDGFSTYGQTEWSLANQFKYMAALAGGCIGDAASRSYLLGQMASVGGSDTFGLGAAGFPAKWKGGWGPGTDGRYLVRQMGVMEVNGKPVVVAMAAIPDDGTFETGMSMLSDLARSTASRLADSISGPTGC